MLLKTGEVRLEGDDYKRVIENVYQRDGWRCRRCDTRQHLTPHHMIKRSDRRIDAEWNLVTLCVECHRLVEESKVLIHGDDANSQLRFRFAVESGDA